jgi:hypothetical protein
MAEANPLWGAPRIHGELLKLGIETSERTVSRLMPRRGKAPSPTWKASLNNHVQDLVAIDFFTVPTATFRVLFVLVALAHRRRRVVHFNVTEHPTALWTGQQMVEAFPEISRGHRGLAVKKSDSENPVYQEPASLDLIPRWPRVQSILQYPRSNTG